MIINIDKGQIVLDAQEEVRFGNMDDNMKGLIAVIATSISTYNRDRNRNQLMIEEEGMVRVATDKKHALLATIIQVCGTDERPLGNYECANYGQMKEAQAQWPLT